MLDALVDRKDRDVAGVVASRRARKLTRLRSTAATGPGGDEGAIEKVRACGIKLLASVHRHHTWFNTLGIGAEQGGHVHDTPRDWLPAHCEPVPHATGGDPIVPGPTVGSPSTTPESVDRVPSNRWA